MDDVIVWVIIIAFYAPLHYLLPVLILFITGNEPEEQRKNLIRGALLDSTLSMIVAFVIIITLVSNGWISVAMLTMLVSMFYPFLRIFRHRKEITS